MSAEADGGRCEGDSADPKYHDPGGRRPAVSTQLYCIMLMICKDAALNTVFLAGERSSRDLT